MKTPGLKLVIPLILALMLLAACAIPTAEPTPTALPTTSLPTAALAAQATPTLPPATPTSAPTNTPLPASTLTATTIPSPISTSASSATPAANATPAVKVTITTIHMLDATNGWAIGAVASEKADQILRTSDGGATWRRVTPQKAILTAANPDQAAAGLFMDNTHAWVAYFDRSPGARPQSSIVYFTQDGGKVWQASDPLDL